ncbi:MAG: glycosyltransferase family 2 protein [Gammaproteobacteria bacterium]
MAIKKIVKPVKKIINKSVSYLLNRLKKNSNYNPYAKWINKNKPNRAELEKQRNILFKYAPKISIVVPTFNTPPKFLIAMLESVLNQTYSNWELCIADGSDPSSTGKGVLDSYVLKDKRIKVEFLSENKGIAGNSNAAIALASGEYIAFLDHDDTLAPDALFELVSTINEQPELKFLYTDYALTDQSGEILTLVFTPNFSRFYYLSHPYLVHLVLVAKQVVDKVGRFDEKHFNEGVSQDVDLNLRIFAELNDKEIGRVPKILYFWRVHHYSSGHVGQEKVHEATRFAQNRYFKLRGLNAWAEDGLTFNTFRPRAKIEGNPLVSIIIPTKDRWELLEKNLNSIKELAGYCNYEIIIVKNNTQSRSANDFLNSLDSTYTVVEYGKPFNYSAINNYAVRNFASGELLLFLNDDVEFISHGFLTAMLELFEFPDVGAVGAKLIYLDERIQHAGVIIGLQNGMAEHWQKFVSAKLHNGLQNPGYLQSLNSVREYSAVTGACLMVKRSLFEEVGGFSESLKLGFNDVDFCLKVNAMGSKVLYTPYALGYHHEHASRSQAVDKEVMEHSEDSELFARTWKDFIDKGDPYYSPNLSLDSVVPVPMGQER